MQQPALPRLVQPTACLSAPPHQASTVAPSTAVAIPAASSGPPAPDAHGSWSGTPGTVSSAMPLRPRLASSAAVAGAAPTPSRVPQPAAHGGDAHDRDCGGRAAGGDQRFTDTLNQLRGRDDGDGDSHDVASLCAARRHALACGGASRPVQVRVAARGHLEGRSTPGGAPRCSCLACLVYAGSEYRRRSRQFTPPLATDSTAPAPGHPGRTADGAAPRWPSCQGRTAPAGRGQASCRGSPRRPPRRRASGRRRAPHTTTTRPARATALEMKWSLAGPTGSSTNRSAAGSVAR